jgi:hypothetical protein
MSYYFEKIKELLEKLKDENLTENQKDIIKLEIELLEDEYNKVKFSDFLERYL